jgi:hypothetical protein
VTRFEEAQFERKRRLARYQRIAEACTCCWPLDVYRNGHGHGLAEDGTPCPAIAVRAADPGPT